MSRNNNKNYFSLTKIEQIMFQKFAGFTPSEQKIFDLRCNTDYTIIQLEEILNLSQKTISNKITSIKIKMDKLRTFFNNDYNFKL